MFRAFFIILSISISIEGCETTPGISQEQRAQIMADIERCQSEARTYVDKLYCDYNKEELIGENTPQEVRNINLAYAEQIDLGKMTPQQAIMEMDMRLNELRAYKAQESAAKQQSIAALSATILASSPAPTAYHVQPAPMFMSAPVFRSPTTTTCNPPIGQYGQVTCTTY